MTRRLFSCHGVVRSGVPDGLVFMFFHGDVRSVYRRFKDGYMVRYIVGLYSMVSRWCLGYGTSLVYMVWYILYFYGTVHCWFLSKT